MKVQQVGLVCFLSALCGGNSGFSAASNIYTGAAGQSGILSCFLLLSGNVKFLCREHCEEGNVLIQTANATAANGRYSLAFTSDASGHGSVHITFTNLGPSDAGKYRFGLGRALLPDLYCDVEIRVANAPLNITSGFILTYRAGDTALYSCEGAANGSRSFLCITSCDTQKNVLIDTTNDVSWAGRYGLVSTQGRLYVLITQTTVGDTGRYLCGYRGPVNSTGSFLALVDAPAVMQSYLLLLTVSLFLVGVLLGGGGGVLLHKCKTQTRTLNQKASDPKHPPNANRESGIYENYDNSFYQSINVATKDQDYTTINK